MDRLVVDSSVAIKWFVAEIHTAESIKIYARYQATDLELLAPDLINAEVGSILWRKQMFGGMSAIDAQKVLSDFRSVDLGLTSTEVLLVDAYQLAVAHKRTVYDSLYLALAQREHCPFVTADEKLYNAVSRAMPDVVLLSNWR